MLVLDIVLDNHLSSQRSDHTATATATVMVMVVLFRLPRNPTVTSLQVEAILAQQTYSFSSFHFPFIDLMYDTHIIIIGLFH